MITIVASSITLGMCIGALVSRPRMPYSYKIAFLFCGLSALAGIILRIKGAA